MHDGVRDGDRFKFPMIVIHHPPIHHWLDMSDLMWEESIFLLNEAPLIGHGPEQRLDCWQSHPTEIRRFKYFHSLWFNLAGCSGTIGTFGFAALFIGFATRSGRMPPSLTGT